MTSPRFIVEGARPLKGSIRPTGNKNAALPILCAALCAYLGDRLAFLIRRRYQQPPVSSSS